MLLQLQIRIFPPNGGDEPIAEWVSEAFAWKRTATAEPVESGMEPPRYKPGFKDVEIPHGALVGAALKLIDGEGDLPDEGEWRFEVSAANDQTQALRARVSPAEAWGGVGGECDLEVWENGSPGTRRSRLFESVMADMAELVFKWKEILPARDGERKSQSHPQFRLFVPLVWSDDDQARQTREAYGKMLLDLRRVLDGVAPWRARKNDEADLLRCERWGLQNRGFSRGTAALLDHRLAALEWLRDRLCEPLRRIDNQPRILYATKRKERKPVDKLRRVGADEMRQMAIGPDQFRKTGLQVETLVTVQTTNSPENRYVRDLLDEASREARWLKGRLADELGRFDRYEGFFRTKNMGRRLSSNADDIVRERVESMAEFFTEETSDRHVWISAQRDPPMSKADWNVGNSVAKWNAAYKACHEVGQCYRGMSRGLADDGDGAGLAREAAQNGYEAIRRRQHLYEHWLFLKIVLECSERVKSDEPCELWRHAQMKRAQHWFAPPLARNRPLTFLADDGRMRVHLYHGVHATGISSLTEVPAAPFASVNARGLYAIQTRRKDGEWEVHGEPDFLLLFEDARHPEREPYAVLIDAKTGADDRRGFRKKVECYRSFLIAGRGDNKVLRPPDEIWAVAWSTKGKPLDGEPVWNYEPFRNRKGEVTEATYPVKVDVFGHDVDSKGKALASHLENVVNEARRRFLT